MHRTALRFGEVAELYERARPGYPPAAIEHLTRHAGLGPGARVADVGAGTGKLTRLLVATGAHVTAVEPVAGMRLQLAAAVQGVEVLDGTAEQLPFDDDSLHVVAAAQAAHWFGSAAADEFARVLRSGGHVVVVFNHRDLGQRVQAVIARVRERVARGAPSRARELWRRHFDACESLAARGHATFAWDFPLAHTGVLDQVRSLAPVAALAEDEREGILDEVSRALLGEPDPIRLRYTTEVDVWQR